MVDPRKFQFADGERLRMEIPKPCPAAWSEMKGDDRARHCCKCDRFVYNLSDMTKAEALELIESTEGPACYRFHQRLDGTVLTRDCGFVAKIGWTFHCAAAAALGIFGLSLLPAPAKAGTGRRLSPSREFEFARQQVEAVNYNLAETKDPKKREALLKKRQSLQKKMREAADAIWLEDQSM